MLYMLDRILSPTGIFCFRPVSWLSLLWLPSFYLFWLWDFTMAFLTGQSWRVLKSWYTGGDPEQGFRRCFTDGLNQRLILSSAQATLPHAQPHTQFFSHREWEWREKTLPLSTGRALGTRLPYVTVSFLAESSPLLSCAYTRTSYTYWKVLYVKECDS